MDLLPLAPGGADTVGDLGGAAAAALVAALGDDVALGLVRAGRWCVASPGMVAVLGRDPVATPDRRGPGEPDLDGPVALVDAGGRPVTDVELVGVDGRRWRASFRPAGPGGGVVVSATDVTRLVDEVDELRHDVAHDPLTGLINRRELVDRLAAALARHEHATSGVVAVVFADIDGFKGVNDRYGHRVGDAVLVAVARRLQAAVRSGDTLGRLGGDEFVLVREDPDGEPDLTGLLDRLVSAVALPVVVDGHRIPVTLSLGLATARRGDDAERALEHADLAMYEEREVRARVSPGPARSSSRRGVRSRR